MMQYGPEEEGAYAEFDIWADLWMNNLFFFF